MRIILALSLAVVSLTFVSNAKAQGQDGSFFLRACTAAEKQSDGTQLSQEERFVAVLHLLCLGLYRWHGDHRNYYEGQGTCLHARARNYERPGSAYFREVPAREPRNTASEWAHFALRRAGKGVPMQTMTPNRSIKRTIFIRNRQPHQEFL